MLAPTSSEYGGARSRQPATGNVAARKPPAARPSWALLNVPDPRYARRGEESGEAKKSCCLPFKVKLQDSQI